MKKLILFFTCIAFISCIFLYFHGRSLWFPYYIKLVGKQSLQEAIQEHEPHVSNTLRPIFESKGLPYPPKSLTLLALKKEKELELWTEHNSKQYLVKKYPILKASGELGPKLIEGDKQVPEGIYKIEGFNPNSSYHLSMKLNYPNEFDLKYAKLESREEPGTNIFIHGKAVSVGCLAMGDSAIEELFVLTHSTGKQNIKVIISPSDPRREKLAPPRGSPGWTETLYQEISLQSKSLHQ